MNLFRARFLPFAVAAISFALASAVAQRGEPSSRDSVATAAPRLYSNPILPGDWSDPGLIRVGDVFYTVRSSFGWQPGLPIARSGDLVHWELVGHGFVAHPKLLPGDTRYGIWGVELGWNPNTKQFLIYAPTRDGEVFVYFAAKPEGPYEVRSLGPNLGIDPGFFADADGRLYFITSRALIHELEPDGVTIKRAVAQIDRTPYKLFEGPAIFQHGGFYYLLFFDGGTLPHNRARSARFVRSHSPDPGRLILETR